MTKKIMFPFLALLFVMEGCSPKSIPVEQVYVDQTEITIVAGQTAILTASVSPSNATEQEFAWSSDNTGIVTVEGSVGGTGLLTAVAPGKATVQVKAGKPARKALCNVTVTEKYVPVENVYIDPKEASVPAKRTITLTATVFPADATDKTCIWSSDDTGIATVNGSGQITGIFPGKTTIRVKAGNPAKEDVCSLTVTEAEEEPTLSRAEAEQTRLKVIDDWKKAETSRLQAIVASQTGTVTGKDTYKNITRTYWYVTDEDNHIMKYFVDTYGNEPEGGHSLWLSLHGGGADDTGEVNDGQWWNQQYMYLKASPAQPTEGIYVSPRGYKDASDLWFFRGNDGLFRQIIETMVVLHGVNPDKVYLMGYSAGGDGVWRMAPRLADHWAAASMMAGHPGNTRFENLRNLPFMMWVGSEDTGYNRNTLVPAASKKIDDLQAADPEGYIHECHVQQGRPHWMELDDVAAFPWMAKYTRNPYPKKIVWRQENEEKKMPEAFFYWLKVADKHISGRSDDDAPGSSNERKKYLGKEITAEISGNTITLSKCDYDTFTIYLNDTMVNLDNDVTVTFNGKQLFSGRVERSEEVMKRSLAERNDPSYCFTAEIIVNTK